MRQFAERLCLQVSSEAILSFKKHDTYLKILSGIIVAHCRPQLVSVKHAAHLYLLSCLYYYDVILNLLKIIFFNFLVSPLKKIYIYFFAFINIRLLLCIFVLFGNLQNQILNRKWLYLLMSEQCHIYEMRINKKKEAMNFTIERCI